MTNLELYNAIAKGSAGGFSYKMALKSVNPAIRAQYIACGQAADAEAATIEKRYLVSLGRRIGLFR